MDPLVVVAQSGYAAEIVGIADRCGHQVGVICGTGGATDAAAVLGLPFHPFGPSDAAARLPAGPVIVGLGGADDRRRLIGALLAEARELPTLIDPDATVGPAVTFGHGTIVSPGARITANVQVGAGVLVHTSAVLSHDDVVGDFATISPSATLCGGVVVEPGAWIAAGATVLPGVIIGEGAVVGAGALVHRDVAPGTTVTGVPAVVRG